MDRKFYEDFRNKVLNRPKPNGPSFFRLQQVIACSLSKGEKRYPKYETDITNTLYFKSLKAAEAKMTQLIEETYEETVVICYYIDEIPFCEDEYQDEIGNCNYTTVSWRLYDEQGILIDQSKVSELDIHHDQNYGSFYGRDTSEIRFKEGDIVEVYFPYNPSFG